MIQTDATDYPLHRTTNAYEANAVATYMNRTGASVFYARCSASSETKPLYTVRRTGPDSTRRLWTDIGWGCVGGVPTGEIRAGDSVRVSVRLGAYDQPTMTPPIQREDLIGLERIELILCPAYHADSEECIEAPLPLPLRQSNAFNVHY